ncbi:unnamed protein product, partial [Leptidea sinapis]
MASFLAIFVVSTTQLIITNGFLQGLGMGLLIPVSYTSFNSYFTRKKVLYLSLCKASIGMITMLYPLFIKYTIMEYGFRGTLAILCAISAHSIFGAMVMHPVEWHMVKKEKTCEKILSDTRRLSIPVVLIPADGNTNKFNSSDNVYIENLYKAASVSSLGNFGHMVEPMPIIKNKEGKWQTAEIANIIAVGGATDMVARLMLGFSGQFFRLNSRYMFYAGALLAALFRLGVGKYYNIAGIGHVNSFGLIYNDFIIDTNSTAKSLTTAHGLFAIMLAVGGILLNIIAKHISLKSGGLTGAALFITGAFTTILITNANQLPITFGILQGIGFGMMVPVCYSTINFYFVRKRTFAMSLVKAIQGIIVMWYPQLLRVIVSFYGFRGVLIILSGISLHTIPGMLTMECGNKTMKIHLNKIAKLGDLENGDKSEETNDLLESKKAKEKDKTLNVRILNDLIYCNICFGQSFVNFSDLTFFILQPMLLFQHGFDKALFHCCFYNNKFLHFFFYYCFSIFYMCVFVVVFIKVQAFIWIAVITGILGALRSCIHVTSSLVISNHVSAADFPGAYALFMLSTGIVNVFTAPLI